MKIIQTFWTRNLPGDALLNISAGWLSPEYHWMSWALSCLLLKKQFGHVSLSTDRGGESMLIDRFGLPYNDVSLELGLAIEDSPPSLWALGKIFTYMQQREPFLHFDGDFFLFNSLPPDLFRAPIACQNLEKDLFFYRDTIAEINLFLPFVPEPCLPATSDEGPLYSCNAGIIGGNDIGFFQEYGRYAFEFANRNTGYGQLSNPSNLNFVFEQYFIHWLAGKKNIPITFLSPLIQEDPSYATFANFNNVPGADFIHPVGGHKKNAGLCRHVASILQLDYPEYYERILRVLKDAPGIHLIRVLPGTQQGESVVNELPADVNDTFRRTLASLDYLAGESESEPALSAIRSVVLKSVDHPSVSIESLIAQAGLSAVISQKLLDLYRFEICKKEKYLELVSEKDIGLRADAELGNYQHVRDLFLLPMATIHEQTILLNPRASILDVTENWICKIPGLTAEMIRDKFSSPATQELQIALVPKTPELQVEEYFLEPMDELMTSHCEQGVTIGSLIQEMQQYFPAEQIRLQYESFHTLMVNTIKRLAYIGILLVGNVSGV